MHSLPPRCLPGSSPLNKGIPYTSFLPYGFLFSFFEPPRSLLPQNIWPVVSFSQQTFGPLPDSFLLHLWDVNSSFPFSGKPFLTVLEDSDPPFGLSEQHDLYSITFVIVVVTLQWGCGIACLIFISCSTLQVLCSPLYLWFAQKLAYCSCLESIYLINEWAKNDISVIQRLHGLLNLSPGLQRNLQE